MKSGIVLYRSVCTLHISTTAGRLFGISPLKIDNEPISLVPNGAVFDRPALGLLAVNERTSVVMKLAGNFRSSKICMSIRSIRIIKLDKLHTIKFHWI